MSMQSRRLGRAMASLTIFDLLAFQNVFDAGC